MVKKSEELKHVFLEHMKGGEGTLERISSVDAGEYESGIKVLGRLRLMPGVSIGEHYHEGEEEIMTILSGSARYIDDGSECILNAGDVAVCLSGHFHSMANASETELLEVFVVVNSL